MLTVESTDKQKKVEIWVTAQFPRDTHGIILDHVKSMVSLVHRGVGR